MKLLLLEEPTEGGSDAVFCFCFMSNVTAYTHLGWPRLLNGTQQEDTRVQGLLMEVSHPSVFILLSIPPHQTLCHSFPPGKLMHTAQKKTLIKSGVLLKYTSFSLGSLIFTLIF